MAGARRAEAKVLSGTRSQNVAVSTAEDFGEDTTAAIIPAATGNLIVQLEDDTAPATISVVQGMMYPLGVRLVDVSNAVAFTAIWNIPAPS
ncbi:hypothetical protein P67b_00087 [Ruegeria phage Tedan]|nr:hypothetical protein P67b_00087 [Ruegeria phage Tedan]